MPESVNKKEVTPDEAEEKARKAQLRAKLAQVLDRGMVNARLEVKDPDPNKHYEWPRNTETDIARMQALGFELEHDKSKAAGLHGQGDSRIVVGDAVLMSTSMENHLVIEELKEERRKRRRAMDAKREYVRMAKARNPVVPVLDPLGVGDSAEEE